MKRFSQLLIHSLTVILWSALSRTCKFPLKLYLAIHDVIYMLRCVHANATDKCGDECETETNRGRGSCFRKTNITVGPAAGSWKTAGLMSQLLHWRLWNPTNLTDLDLTFPINIKCRYGNSAGPETEDYIRGRLKIQSWHQSFEPMCFLTQLCFVNEGFWIRS